MMYIKTAGAIAENQTTAVTISEERIEEIGERQV